MAGYCQVINKLSMSMTKAQLVEGLAKNCKLSKKAVNDVLNEMAAMAYKEVKRNGEFIVPGIGKLVRVQRKARTGRNPATGAQIRIPAKNVVRFRVAKAVKDAVV
ncbi:MAG TPA: HU family DNA-binding protein [bacterium]|jgi:DNA-binding protein HU-beta|nr:HU family DNA-binding protein [bacterium]HPU92371.1 HU family DNA-binding protein [bacterium]HPX64768.1 HU family DNA-binding protein [bacterium]HQB26556.1 HU family DNA-binding protein [bacterium]